MNIFKINGSEDKLDDIIQKLYELNNTNECILAELQTMNQHLQIITNEEIENDND